MINQIKSTLLILFVFMTLSSFNSKDVIIDSNLSFDEAIKTSPAPADIINDLTLVNVEYYSTDNKLHRGQLVVNKSVASDVKEIFELIKSIKFPVNKCIPMVKYKWSDSASMKDNNSSSFCYRTIAGTNRISKHAMGKAVDINPFFNPVIYEDGKISPKGAKYNPKKPGTFSSDHPIVKKFIELGWRWGGNFQSFKDYHHFDKE